MYSRQCWSDQFFIRFEDSVSPTYKLGSDIVVEMKRIQEMNENITKTMDNQESDSSILDWKVEMH